MRGTTYKDRADMRRKGPPRPKAGPTQPRPKPGDWADYLIRQMRREPTEPTK